MIEITKNFSCARLRTHNSKHFSRWLPAGLLYLSLISKSYQQLFFFPFHLIICPILTMAISSLLPLSSFIHLTSVSDIHLVLVFRWNPRKSVTDWPSRVDLLWFSQPTIEFSAHLSIHNTHYLKYVIQLPFSTYHFNSLITSSTGFLIKILCP